MFNIRYLFLTPLFFMFFPAWGIFYSSTSSISISFLFRLIFVPIILFIEKNKLTRLFIDLLKNTPAKYLFMFFVWIIISGICSVFLNNYSLGNFFYKLIFGFITSCIFTYFMTLLLFPKFFSIKTICKIILIGNFFVFTIGIIEGIAKAFDITPIINFTDFLINQRTWTYLGEMPYMNRVHSTFAEPGWLGSFICFNIPILYSLMNSPYKLFKNRTVNFVLKKLTPFLALINLFLTKSPIWLVIFILITLFFYLFKIIKFFKKYLKVFLLIMIIFFITLGFTILIVIHSDLSVQDTYIYRIVVFLYNFSDFQQLVLAEPSLATRMLSYFLTLLVFINHPIIGVGFGNTENHVIPIIESTNLPYTNEIMNHYSRSINSNSSSIHINGAIFYNTLADTGIIGFILLYTFMLKSFIFIKKLIKHLHGIERDFASGLAFTILVIIITSIYDAYINVVYIWFLFGAVISCYFSVRFKRIV